MHLPLENPNIHLPHFTAFEVNQKKKHLQSKSRRIFTGKRLYALKKKKVAILSLFRTRKKKKN